MTDTKDGLRRRITSLHRENIGLHLTSLHRENIGLHHRDAEVRLGKASVTNLRVTVIRDGGSFTCVGKGFLIAAGDLCGDVAAQR